MSFSNQSSSESVIFTFIFELTIFCTGYWCNTQTNTKFGCLSTIFSTLRRFSLGKVFCCRIFLFGSRLLFTLRPDCVSVRIIWFSAVSWFGTKECSVPSKHSFNVISSQIYTIIIDVKIVEQNCKISNIHSMINSQESKIYKNDYF